MGTDIHMIAQARPRGTQEPWRDIPLNYSQDRHYLLFAWLANVRNGFGFAGTPTGEPIIPLSDPRGLPQDFQLVNAEEHPTTWEAVAAIYRDEFWCTREAWEKKGSTFWMGDHSYSWLAAEEILDSSKRPGAHMRHGVVDIDTYCEWKASGDANPTNWCGSVSGKDIIVVCEPQDRTGVAERATHVSCTWTDPDDGLGYFVDAVQAAADAHPDDIIRVVFGFDS